jgi:hypothetical protein
MHSQMVSVFFVFLSACRHAHLMNEGMHCYASTITMYMCCCKIGTLHLYCWHSWQCWPSTGGKEYDQGGCPINHMWLHGRLFLVLVEFDMVMWRWENQFLNWSLKMLPIMCCYKKCMLLLATGILVRMLNSNKKKGAWRNSWFHLDWSE